MLRPSPARQTLVVPVALRDGQAGPKQTDDQVSWSAASPRRRADGSLPSIEIVGQFRIHLAMSLCCVSIDGYSKIKIGQSMEIVERIKSADGGCKYLLSTGDLTKTVESTLFYLDEQRLPYLYVCRARYDLQSVAFSAKPVSQSLWEI